MSDMVITFGSDLSKVRADLNAFQAELQGRPIGLPFALSGAQGRGPATGNVPPAIANPMGFVPGPTYGGSGFATGGPTGATGGIQAATNELVSAIRSAASSVRGGNGRTPRGPWDNIPAAWEVGGSEYMRRLSSGGGTLPPALVAAAAFSAGGGGGGSGGGAGAYTQKDLNQLAAVVATRDASGGGGGGNGGATGGSVGGRGSGLRYARGLFRLYAGMELLHVARGTAIAGTQAHYAETPQDALDAEIQGIDSTTSGFFGGLVGFGTDLADRLGQKLGFNGGVGPTRVRQLAIEAKALQRATFRAREDQLSAASTARTIAGGPGRYGSSAANIENSFKSDQLRISEEREDASNLQDATIKKDRMAGLTARDRANEARRTYALKQRGLDFSDEIAGYGDEAAVAGGRMTSGAARRAVMLRRRQRQIDPLDQQAADAELGAFDAQEGYRIWQREYAAGDDYQQAADRFNRQPNVGRARGIYNRGTLEYENARREGSQKEADLIRRRTALELGGFQRDLMESGHGVEVQNGSLDIGQRGSPLLGVPEGLQSSTPGDDTGAALKKIADLLESMGVKMEDLTQWAKENL